MTSVDLGGFFPQEKPLPMQQLSAPFPCRIFMDDGTHPTGEGHDWLGKATDRLPGSNGEVDPYQVQHFACIYTCHSTFQSLFISLMYLLK